MKINFKHLAILAIFMQSLAIAAQPADWPKNPVMYEVNLRHHTAEGTIKAFIPEVEKLHAMGVNILWIMPVQPIGYKKRKAKGDLFVEDIADSILKKKYLGSPYSIQNYTAVNPDYGTTADFKKLVEACHARGMKIILDWVGNHTAWDHAWIQSHPDWYTHNSAGEITDPLNEQGQSIGWTDVADLNYDNEAMQQQMIADMAYWLDSCNIDGFRCDVAMSIPSSFWNKAHQELNKHKSIFMLAESEEHDMGQFTEAFDAYYAWEMHHFLNQIAQGKKTAQSLDTLLKRKYATFPKNVYAMNFITNHDENSWNGTEYERMGKAWKAMAVYTFTIPGIPLLYTGQETGNNKRMRFFEKDTADHASNAKEYETFYTALATLKRNNAALSAIPAHNKGVFLDAKNPNILVYCQKYKGNWVWVAINMSDKAQTIGTKIPKGKVYMEEGIQGKTLEPWGYQIRIK